MKHKQQRTRPFKATVSVDYIGKDVMERQIGDTIANLKKVLLFHHIWRKSAIESL